LADERLGGMARTVGMLERPQALALQRGADSLLVFAEGASAPSVATNKLFEYLAARRPVLVLGDNSEAARIVRAADSGIGAPAGDPQAIAEAVRKLVAGDVQANGVDLDQYAWPALAERFEREICASAVSDRAAAARARRPRRRARARGSDARGSPAAGPAPWTGR
jgi:glycosyltransferase involved in cell wall biosynthesis